MAVAAQPGAAHCIMPAVEQNVNRAGEKSCENPVDKQLNAQATSCHMSGGWPSALICSVEGRKMYDQKHIILPEVGVGAMATSALEPSLKTHTHWWFLAATPLPVSKLQNTV